MLLAPSVTPLRSFLLRFACCLTDEVAAVRPPVVSFKWRHWGVMQGPLRCPLGLGQELSASATGQKIQVCPYSEAYPIHATSNHGTLRAVQG